MKITRGEIWLADLNPIRGSEQAGIRPVLILQNNAMDQFTSTVLAIPLTTNLRRAALPSMCADRPRGRWAEERFGHLVSPVARAGQDTFAEEARFG